jgi:asparagine synthase (glutamine-hydrolysing)
MVERLGHRGPDDRGLLFSGPEGLRVHDEVREAPAPTSSNVVALGHTRLSIIDLTRAGRQPMSNEDGRLWITYNGEIYNFKEIRRELQQKGHRFRSNTDTEVIVHAYEEWGAACLSRFNGMFAFGIYDTKDQSIFLARDRLGIKPLYWCTVAGRLAFASEVKALFPLPWVKREVDWQAMLGYLLFLWCPEPRTAFKGIEKLPAGHWLMWKDGQAQVHPYWNVAWDGEAEDPGEAAYLEQLDELMHRAVSRRMLSDVPVGVLLSGGLDSSLIAALMSRMSDRPVTAYTIAFDERDKAFEAMPDDQVHARRVADHIGADHREILIRPEIVNLLRKMLWHLEEPIADPAAINTYLICRMAKERGTTVMLSGLGADEIFAGYRKHLSVALARHYRAWVPSLIREGWVRPLIDRLPVASRNGGYRTFRWANRFVKNVSRSDLECFIGNYAYYNAAEINDLLQPEFRFDWETAYPIQRHYDYYRDVQGRDLISQMTYLDTKLFLPGLNLAYSDKASMAAAVEERVPFVDHEMVTFALTLPAKYRLQGFHQKYLLKKLAARYLPEEVVKRPKAPFGAPLRAWMHRDLAEMVDDLLSEESVKKRGYFRYDVIRRIVEENRCGRQDYGHRLWGLMTIELWHRIFIDGETEP